MQTLATEHVVKHCFTLHCTGGGRSCGEGFKNDKTYLATHEQKFRILLVFANKRLGLWRRGSLSGGDDYGGRPRPASIKSQELKLA